MAERIVLDCNLLVSALMSAGSPPGRTFDLAREKFEIALSEPCLAELFEILHRKKFERYFSREEADLFLEVFREAATFFEPTERIAECRDPKDDKYLELAMAANARFLVSGDQDLLSMNPFRGMPILSPRAIVEMNG